ncbi:protein-S-isoprenylcysteine methyltransferase [Mycobacteroides abscessus subsp. abscessus]|nr:protein-S-isoprenylcysteine methyltransferase [Mycobacteroides abscessus subsp. abscessus]
MAVAALALYVVFIAAGFGWKSYRQWRTTGSTGFRGFHGRPGTREWLAGVGFSAAIALGAEPDLHRDVDIRCRVRADDA